MDITKPALKWAHIYPLFHFFPGNPDIPKAKRKDHKPHPLICFNTIPNSGNARNVFHGAIATKNLYRIGIATHVYADTWAHQNFIGMKDKFNAEPTMKIIPNIGHADFVHDPDQVDHGWKDPRLIEENIDNNKRFLEAAENIFSAYCCYNNSAIDDDTLSQKWNELKGKLTNAMHEKGPFHLGRFDLDPLDLANKKARLKAYKSICADIREYEYDKEEWLWKAIKEVKLETDPFDRYWAKDNFKESRWYKFQEAIRQHYELSLYMLKPIYEKTSMVNSDEEEYTHEEEVYQRRLKTSLRRFLKR